MTATLEPTELPSGPLELSPAAHLRVGPNNEPFVHHAKTGRVVALHGPAEKLITMLDGRFDFDELVRSLGVDQEPTDPRYAALARFVGGLNEAGMFDDDETQPAPPPPPVEVEHLPRELPPGWRIRLRLTQRFDSEPKPLTGLMTLSMVVIGILAVLGFGYVGAGFGNIVTDPADMPERTVGIIAVTLGVMLVQIACHEAAHALALRAFGLSVREVGLRFWLYILPVPYVSQAGEVFLPRRRQRAAVALAGVASDGIIGVGVWLALLQFTNPATAVSWALIHFAVVQVNLNPLLPTDGARLVESLLGEVSLRSRSVQWAKAKLFRRPVPPGSPTTWGKQAYGVASLAIVGLLIVVVVYQVVRLVALAI